MSAIRGELIPWEENLEGIRAERIRVGKELLEAKRIEEENERKRLLVLRKAEKEEERRAREKIRQKLEEDKAERRRKLGLPPENPDAAKPSAPVVEEKKSSLPVRPATKAEQMRECLRSLKQNHKDLLKAELLKARGASRRKNLWSLRREAQEKRWEYVVKTPCSEHVYPTVAPLQAMLGLKLADDEGKVKTAFNTLMTYAKNVATNPNEEKFRKIRVNNAHLSELNYRNLKCMAHHTLKARIGGLKGGIEFLELCGFEKIEGGEYLFLPRDKVDRAVLNSAGTELNNAINNPFFGVL
ncbi:ubiquitin-associated (UBA)/TS-N domain-containing protein [Actinidia rufa]|uniref:Ubiquitin-associated (UBA)/TS-N domain-containing protein n=1 Tax=Actinidia rufa TaxID=165716 RepID=A0A7J0E946_9ERIC|nr:ubiquitin-associated (UBA)/TS-N domain-containing protein [Actinidia rufa]